MGRYNDPVRDFRDLNNFTYERVNLMCTFSSIDFDEHPPPPNSESLTTRLNRLVRVKISTRKKKSKTITIRLAVIVSDENPQTIFFFQPTLPTVATGFSAFKVFTFHISLNSISLPVSGPKLECWTFRISVSYLIKVRPLFESRLIRDDWKARVVFFWIWIVFSGIIKQWRRTYRWHVTVVTATRATQQQSSYCIRKKTSKA